MKKYIEHHTASINDRVSNLGLYGSKADDLSTSPLRRFSYKAFHSYLVNEHTLKKMSTSDKAYREEKPLKNNKAAS